MVIVHLDSTAVCCQSVLLSFGTDQYKILAILDHGRFRNRPYAGETALLIFEDVYGSFLPIPFQAAVCSDDLDAILRKVNNHRLCMIHVDRIRIPDRDSNRTLGFYLTAFLIKYRDIKEP